MIDERSTKSWQIETTDCWHASTPAQSQYGPIPDLQHAESCAQLTCKQEAGKQANQPDIVPFLLLVALVIRAEQLPGGLRVAGIPLPRFHQGEGRGHDDARGQASAGHLESNDTMLAGRHGGGEVVMVVGVVVDGADADDDDDDDDEDAETLRSQK
jgi:hypothetical protein